MDSSFRQKAAKLRMTVTNIFKNITMKKLRQLFLLLFLLPFFTSAQISSSTIQSMIDSVSLSNLTAHIETLQAAGGHWSRVNFTPGNDSAVAYIKRSFDAMPCLDSVALDTFFISSATPPLNVQPLANVVATITGKKDPTKMYVIGAHLDCSASRMGSSVWSTQWKTLHAPGADDNATGVAALLEAARILSDTSFGFHSDYTLKFVAFGAEEQGPAYSDHHFGSRHFAAAVKTSNETLLGEINLDMIGYNDSYLYQSIIANETSVSLWRSFLAANDTFNIGLGLNHAEYAVDPGASWSDHASFWENGFPAICLIEYAPPWNNGTFYKANPYYHTSSDTFETVNMELVKRITQATVATVSTLSSTVTGVVENNSLQPPAVFSLSQNYPNPFNPTTNIKYQLPITNEVTLKVFDVLGREVATLVNERKSQGMYEVEWNAAKMPSGIYFCRLQAGALSETKKLVLVK